VLLPAGGVGGLALGAWALRQGGMSAERIARSSVAFFVLTSGPNFLCAAIFGCALAAGVLPGAGPILLSAALGVLALAAIVVVALLPRILDRVGEGVPLAVGETRRIRLGRLARTAARTVAGLIGALALYGSPLSQATAAVLAYRVVQLGLPAIFGSIAFLQLRHTLGREEAPAALCEPFGEPLPVVSLPPRS
jgi:hypothetical protein